MFRLPAFYSFNSTSSKTIRIDRHFAWKCQWKSLEKYHNVQIFSKNLYISSKQTTVNTTTEALRPIIDKKKIFRSPHEDMEIHPGYIHQFVWSDIHLWWNHTALICAQTGRSYTYRELKQLSERFATSIREINLEPGSTLAIVLPNVPEYAITVLGASIAGVRVTLINPSYTAYEISKQLENSDADAVITNNSKNPVIMESLKLANISHKPVIVISDNNDVPFGGINFWNLISNRVQEFGKTGGRTMLNPETDTSVMPYSSGTTGLPKGVELTHRNIVANLCQSNHPEYNGKQQTHDDYQDIIPLLLPNYHIYGLVICLLASLSTGCKLICMPQFTSNNLLDLLDKHRVTLFYAVPPILQLMSYDDRFQKRHLEETKIVACGAAPVTMELVAHFEAKMGSNFDFYQGYGLSETSPVISTGKVTDIQSVGCIVPNTQIKVVDTESDDRKNLGFNESGEIFVRGPQVMKGYYNNKKSTDDCMDGQWFKTGDIGHIDDKGQLFITGRIKELIKVQGCQVSPTELENIIQSHEKIVDVAIIGVPHEKFGEVPKAFVIPKSGETITEEEIKQYVADRVVKYKQIGHVVITDNIPKSPAGKILRRELKNLEFS